MAKEVMTRRWWIEYAVYLLPVIVALQVIDIESMPLLKGVLVALAIGSIWGAALSVAQMTSRRVRHGVWSLKPVDNERDR
ncbi:hypothetical protein [Aeromicrobium chenweiae]|uniref:Uncharacterized protein n=1 Tax=Aeromicrobium chenweiae TaxID=2079793 RepID=A0A2S0WLJ4_9ACTN|nr:hypothetical protein [Aeromicrobium chenweiae]AWB92205.1 hypothetical protein C3E78_08330 [Aeromicrobium chenweiae]TGN31509.1 hypothetical protein E4L97_14235 [Aeromicrobium chenweiae]